MAENTNQRTQEQLEQDGEEIVKALLTLMNPEHNKRIVLFAEKTDDGEGTDCFTAGLEAEDIESQKMLANLIYTIMGRSRVAMHTILTAVAYAIRIDPDVAQAYMDARVSVKTAQGDYNKPENDNQ